MIEITQELSKNFIDFAYEANSQRAFPDVRDGLKPGQRACLWEMYIKGYFSNKPHVKSAKISGGIVSDIWPHSNEAVYETFARMSMPWINNIPEIDFHGSNGNPVIGNECAAQRYTEARLSSASEQGFFEGMKKKPVPMIWNFSEDMQWAEFFPAIFPRLAVNGSQGLGVTIAQTWLPMNLTELGKVIKEYIETNIIDYSNALIDFPTKGIIINKNDISAIHKTGKGTVIVRGKANIKGNSILITEFPYQVYIEPFIDDIKKLIENETITGIENIYNKSDKKRLLVEIVCNENPEKILKILYAKTDLQKSFHANQFALDNKTPKLFTLKDYLDSYIRHNINCICNEYKYDLQKAKEKLEIIEGLIKALAHIDDIIHLIKTSESSKDAESNLINKYDFTQNQAASIVDMKLGKLAKLESVELNKTQKELISNIETCNSVLSNQNEQRHILLNRLDNFIKNFGFERRTQLAQIDESKEVEEEKETIEKCQILTNEKDIIRVSEKDSIKNKNSYTNIYSSDTSKKFLIFTSFGKVYPILVKNIPETKTSINTLISLSPQEKIIFSGFAENDKKYLFCATTRGTVKKLSIDELQNIRKGTAIIKLKDFDTLVSCFFMNDEDVVLCANNDKIIRFKSDISATGKTAIGVKGIRLNDDEALLSACCLNKPYVLLIKDNGKGVLFEQDRIPVQGRGGKGVSHTGVSAIIEADLKDSIFINGSKISIRNLAINQEQILTKNKITSILRSNI